MANDSNAPAREQIAAWLDQLADRDFYVLRDQVQELQAPGHIALLMEVCRALDFHHVRQVLSPNPRHHMPEPEFTAMIRGWNLALALLLPHAGGSKGVPLVESTAHSIAAATSILVRLGNITLIRENAAMIRHGMADAEYADDVILLKGSERLSTDHFLDRLEATRLQQLDEKMRKAVGVDRHADNTATWKTIEARMEQILFPWKPGNSRGTMVGYGAEPEIDNYFLSLVGENVLGWRDDAGIHPDARIGNVSGHSLTSVGMLLTSFYLKHIHFVDLGRKQYADINYPMSLTIWKLPSELTESIAAFTGMDKADVSSVLDLFTIRPTQCRYFLHERTPYLPMLIEISAGYLLAPICSIFRNPLAAVRMFEESNSHQTAASLRGPRENWMISDLCHLFLGSRYQRFDRPARLRLNGKDLTDIDAAILDLTTGDLALFQLKWQDFNTNDIRSQRSKAKNFVERVDRWTEAVESWLREFGKPALGGLLRIDGDIAEIKPFAIGRSSARFRSYGYSLKSNSVVPCVWAQFVRLRHEVGTAEHVFRQIADRALNEAASPVQAKPIPHEIVVGGQKIRFEDLWNTYDSDVYSIPPLSGRKRCLSISDFSERRPYHRTSRQNSGVPASKDAVVHQLE